ncbi:MAG: tetratricopeptide repeat-containing glycosyltransferase family protein [Rhodovibrionaceae bacterium]
MADTLDLTRLRDAAVKAHQDGRLDSAIAGYKRLLAMKPDSAGIWSNLGAALRAQKKTSAALACHRRALELNPEDGAFHGNCGNVLKDLGRVEEAVAAHERAVALQPDSAGAYHNLGIALREAAQHRRAVEAFEAALKLDPSVEKIAWDRAVCLLHLGSFAEGWKAYEARWVLGELPNRRPDLPYHKGEPLEGKTVVVTLEQGFGDSILSARFLPQLRETGATVWLDVKPPLRRLFSQLDGVDRITDPDKPAPGADYQIPIMSLPGMFETTLENLPPPPELRIPEAARRKVAPLVAAGGVAGENPLRIGIVWSGSVTFRNNHNRAAPLERFIGLSDVPGVRLYSLQKGPQESDLRTTGAETVMTDIGGQVQDFAETAAAIEMMDLIVMTDSSVAHLAGSLGTPVWNLLNFVPYWLYLEDREDCPWYPAMRLFRQPEFGDWDSVFAQVKAELPQLIAAKRKRAGKST